MHGVSHLPELDAYGERVADLPVEPLLITARTDTPVASNDPVALDGILAWAMITEALEGKTFPRVDAPVWQPLPLALEYLLDDLPLWRSTDFLPVKPLKGSTHIHRRTSDNPYALAGLRQTLGDRRPRRYPNELAGPYMNFRVPEKRVSAERWEAICVGNRAEVTRLLSYVQFFGKAHKRGCGFVAEWTVEPADGFSFFNEIGEALRPIPVSAHTGIGVQQGWTPPYWLRETWRVCRPSMMARLI